MAYKRPPIVEAVIELRFLEMAPYEVVEKAAKRFAKLYPIDETEFEIEAQITGVGLSQMNEAPVSRRLASNDRSELLLLRRAGYLFSQLPPYPGWGAFLERAKRDYSKAKIDIGPRKLGRIGVRYINRIDIPSEGGAPNVEDFMTFGPPSTAFGAPRVDGYTLSMDKDLIAEKCRVRVTSAILEQVVPKTWPLLLDIDLYRQVDLPTRDGDLWALIEKTRELKNAVFEACITGATREIFQR